MGISMIKMNEQNFNKQRNSFRYSSLYQLQQGNNREEPIEMNKIKRSISKLPNQKC